MNDKARKDATLSMTLRQVVEASGLGYLFTTEELKSITHEPRPELPCSNYSVKYNEAIINLVMDKYNNHEPSRTKVVCIDTVFVQHHKDLICIHFAQIEPNTAIEFYKGLNQTFIHFITNA